jgi:enoyl-CoA hydratase/carnithine racemase
MAFVSHYGHKLNYVNNEKLFKMKMRAGRCRSASYSIIKNLKSTLPTMPTEQLIQIEERGHAGLITLNRPKSLNALGLGMIRETTAALLAWKDAAHIKLVAIRGMGKQADGSFAPFGAFCAGGDIRFFHQAALAGDPKLEDFFTEEYSLNHLIHTYPKPYVVFMDGINMGGGMGISGHGGANSVRIATERLKMAMPETNIGLFPDVGGGWFLSRCMNSQPGIGEYLALTGQMLHAQDAQALGLADACVSSESLAKLWDALPTAPIPPAERDALQEYITINSIALRADFMPAIEQNRLKISAIFDQSSIQAIFAALQAEGSDWAHETIALLRKRSPLMLAVTLELIRRARTMSLADELRLERDLVRHCFHTKHLSRNGVSTETVEGIRALAVDKDHSPSWNPERIEDITPEMVSPFFDSPWPAHAHPLRQL